METNRILKTISLSKAKLDDFMSIGSYIDCNATKDTIPITTQVKIEIIFGVCYLTKSNTINFVVYSFETSEEDVQMLISEEMLRSFLSYSKSQTVQIIERESTITLSDGTGNKPEISKELFDFTLFPKTPKTKANQYITLDKKAIDFANIAKNFVSRDDLRPTFLYVHIKGDFIFSTTTILNYTNILDCKYGDELISLSPLECKLISNFDSVQVFDTKNHSIIKCGDATYGCTKKANVDDKSDEFKMFNSNLKRENFCRISKVDLYNFINSTIILSKSIKNCYVNATFEVVSNNQILLNFVEQKVKNPMHIGAQIKGVPIGTNFAFSQESVMKLLNNIPYDEICITPIEGTGMIAIWSQNDPNFIAISMQMHNVNHTE
jgi:hypothetical protein